MTDVVVPRSANAARFALVALVLLVVVACAPARATPRADSPSPAPTDTVVSAVVSIVSTATAVPTPTDVPQPLATTPSIEPTLVADNTIASTPTVAPIATPAATVVSQPSSTPASLAPAAATTGDACAVTKIVPVSGASTVASWYGPVVEAVADRSGVFQLHLTNPGVSNVCLTCTARPGLPAVDRGKVMPNPDPAGKWVVAVVEGDQHQPFRGTARQKSNALYNGWFSDLWALTTDGTAWYRLTNYVSPSSGVTGVLSPHFSPDGSKVLFAKLVAPPTKLANFGFYEMYLADFVVGANGVPSLQNVKNILPGNPRWFEPEGFSPDGSTIIFQSDYESTNPGQDVWSYNLSTGALKNLTRTPDQWDEHARYSPSGKKIVWMSSTPYASSGPATTNRVRTEEMLMNSDGTNVQQLTHFNTPGYAESSSERSFAAIAQWSPDGSQMVVGQNFLDNGLGRSKQWLLTFAGKCGG